MTVRTWSIEDVDEIARLEAECFPVEPWTRRMLVDSFLSPNFYGVLIEEHGAIVAYGGVSTVCDEGEIQLVATAEMYRRCGRGGAVLNALVEEAKNRGAKSLFLEVRVSNSSAQMLYLKHGFQGVYARSRYYQDGEDALVMKKEII